MLKQEMTIEQQIIFLSEKIIKIVKNIKGFNEDEKVSILKEMEYIIIEPKEEDISKLVKTSNYLEDKTKY